MKEIKIIGSKLEDALEQIDTFKELSPKERGCLCLLTEEMFSLCRELLSIYALDFKIQQNDKQYALSCSTKTKMDMVARDKLLSVSSSGKNAANKGVKGMLGAVLELFFLEGAPEIVSYAHDYSVYGMYGISIMGPSRLPMWTLSQHMNQIEAIDVDDKWDGLEKSIIANFADDVSIGLRNGKVEMTVTKIFPLWREHE